MSIFAELKRRNVFEVGAGCSILAWLLNTNNGVGDN